MRLPDSTDGLFQTFTVSASNSVSLNITYSA